MARSLARRSSVHESSIETLPMFDLAAPTAEPDRCGGERVEGGGDSPTVAKPPRRADAAAALPAVLDVETAGQLLGLGRSAAYELVKSGAWPTPVLRLGRRWRVPTGPLLALLGIDRLQPSVSGGRLRTSPTAPAIFRHDKGDQR